MDRGSIEKIKEELAEGSWPVILISAVIIGCLFALRFVVDILQTL